jgi:hypothetical protein
MRPTGCPRGQTWSGVSPYRAKLVVPHVLYGLPARVTLVRCEPGSGATDGGACATWVAHEGSPSPVSPYRAKLTARGAGLQGHPGRQ